jgi:hypothetical protein
MFAVTPVLGLGLKIKIYSVPTNVQLFAFDRISSMHQLLADKSSIHMCVHTHLCADTTHTIRLIASQKWLCKDIIDLLVILMCAENMPDIWYFIPCFSLKGQNIGMSSCEHWMLQYCGNTPVLYLEGSRFKFWPDNCLYWLRFLIYFPYFEKMKVGLCHLHAVCLCIPPHQLFNCWTNHIKESRRLVLPRTSCL